MTMTTEWARVGTIFGLMLLATLCPSLARAQSVPDDDAPIRVILAPGVLLAGGTELESGIGAVVHVAVERGRHRVVFRSAGFADFAGFPDGSGDGDLTEVGLLYGRRGGGTGPGWSLSAGVSAVHFQRCPEEPEDPFDDPGCTALGLAVVAEAGLGARVIGLGLQLFGNLNSQAPFAGLGLTLPLGWMP